MKPTGVKILSVLTAGYGVIVLACLIFAYSHLDIVRSWSSTAGESFLIAGDIAILTPIHIAFAGLLAYGLWSLQDWARRGVICFAAIGIVKLALNSPATGRPTALSKLLDLLPSLPANGSGVFGYAGIAALICVIAYLSMTSVRQSFTNSAKSP
jgi:hypothetical protein